MKKIIVNETQYKRLFSEQVTKTEYVPPKLTVPPQALSDTLTTAMNLGLDLKKTASSEENQVTWEELGYDVDKLPKSLKTKYPKYVPEIISGFGEKKYFNVKLLSLLKLIEDKTGLDLIVTGGNDYYHQSKRSGSNHNTGNAIDFEVIGHTGSPDDEVQKKVEKAVLSIAMGGEYSLLSFINEYQKSTGGTGGHFHIGLLSDLNYYHYYDTALRVMGHPHHMCCDKGVLKFKGTGSNIKDIVRDARKKEPQPKRVDTLKAKPFVTDTPTSMPPIDVKQIVNDTVNSMGEMTKKEIKNNIKQYDEYIKMSSNKRDRDYLVSVKNGLVKLLKRDEV